MTGQIRRRSIVRNVSGKAGPVHPPTLVELQRVASAFSTAVLRDLAAPGGWNSAKARLQPIASLVCAKPDATLADAFVAGEALLRRHYRNEYVYKNDLISRIVFGRHSPNTSSAILELSMGPSCADVMILNGTSTIYEVKTDLDQFDRLAAQLRSYVSRAEFVNVVIGEKRSPASVPALPATVGLMISRTDGSFSTIRAATSNLDLLNADHLYQLLRQDESLAVLRQLTGYELDVPSGHAWKRMRELFSREPIEALHPVVVNALKQRGRPAANLARAVGYPPALRALAYATPLTNPRLTRITEGLGSPANEICHA